jgi:hypothetical protein
MPELTPQSTTPVPIATPPRIPPESWEDFPVFRETFLLYLTEKPGNDALRVVGRLFHELVLEYSHLWPDWPEGTTTTELRAALADLRHLQGFLGTVGQEQETAALAHGETYLSRLAARQAGELARIGDEIERAIGGEV